MKKSLQTKCPNPIAKSLDGRMKLGMILMMILVSSFQTFASGSEVILSTWNQGSFIIEWDHERFYAKGKFLATDLEEGKHRLRVLKEQINIHSGKKRVRVMYNGFLDVDRNTRMVVEIQSNNRLKVVRKTKLKPTISDGCHTINQDDYVDYGSNNHHGEDECYIDVEDVESNEDLCDTDHGDHGHSEEDQIFDQSEFIMNVNSYESLIQLLEDEWFDSKKVLIAKSVLDQNNVSSEQVKGILETLGFESARLDLAKYAYDSTIDKENYFILFSLFNFESSIRELQNHINN